MDKLLRVMESDPVRLEPLEDHHIEPLREACAQDQEIWQIYPVNLGGDQFDAAIAFFRSSSEWTNFAVVDVSCGKIVGLTNYIRPTVYGVVEIGGTYISPSVRGGCFNRTMKSLMIDNAFKNGFMKVEFRVDTRNARSMAAVKKLGAQHEGTTRQDMVTWTGYRRDTAIFGLLREEWAG